MSINEKIEQQLASAPVVLYMKGTPDFPQCGFSSRVAQVLQECNANYRAINILEDQELREGLKVYSNWPTYPQLYVNGELVGGCDIVMDLFLNGQLKTMLDSPAN